MFRSIRLVQNRAIVVARLRMVGRSNNNRTCRAHPWLLLSSPHHQQQQCRSYRWVPLAYRGAAKSHHKEEDEPMDFYANNSDLTKEQQQQQQRRRTPLMMNKKEQAALLLANKEAKKRRENMQKKEDRLLGLHNELFRLAKEYRACLSSPEPFNSDEVKPIERNISSSSLFQEQEQDIQEKRALMQRMMRQIRILCSDIHQADAFVKWKQIEKTENQFRAMCRIFQDTIVLSTDLKKELSKNEYYSNSNNNVKKECVDLAELALLTLMELRSDRALLVESTKKWSAEAATLGSKKSSPGAARNDKAPRISAVASSLKGLFGVFFDSSPSSSSSTTPNESDDDDDDDDQVESDTPSSMMITNMAHEDPSLGIRGKTFGVVLEAIAAEVLQNGESIEETEAGREETSSSSPPKSNNNKVDRAVIEKTARRMLNLLDAAPANSLSRDQIQQEALKVLEMLARVGNLQSAQTAFDDVFQRYHTPQYRLRLSLVLEAYVQAAKFEKDDEKRKQVVGEIVRVLHKAWNAELPKHRVERIMQASIVLRCMCIVNRKDPSLNEFLCSSTRSVVNRALGSSTYAQLTEIFASDDYNQYDDADDDDANRLDSHALPLVNYLVQLNAFSRQDESKIKEAKHMLSYMMQHDQEGVGSFIVFPNVETFNAMLAAIVDQYQGKSSEKKAAKEIKSDDDVKYAISLLDYMLGRRETGCWPNDETFLLLYRLLLATNPEDIGERAEDILSKMQVRQSLSTKRLNPVTISLSTYHRVLRCWLEAAKSESTKGAAERALLLLDKLEVQSTPLFMNFRETRMSSVPRLYESKLRPTPNTFSMVLRICKETANKDEMEQVAEVALDVYRRILLRDMTSQEQALTSLATKCCTRLPEESNKRKEIEQSLRLLLQETLERRSQTARIK